jgi:E3 ubiquitin-protein ligase MARCH6
MLQLDPYRLLQLLHFPIRAMRIITDPIVDSLVFLVVRFVLPLVLGIARRVINTLALSGLLFLVKLFGQMRVDEASQALIEMVRSSESIISG